jgi:xanthine dehydrogenase YagR molybdenum-binding subunit
VTGSARYAAEYPAPGLLYGYIVTSTIARGRISRIDAADALSLPGVVQVLTHENTPTLTPGDGSVIEEVGAIGTAFLPLQDDRVWFSAQPVALVVADSFELARYAASLVRIEYAREEHVTNLDAVRAQAYVPKIRPILPPTPQARGQAVQAFSRAAVQVDAEYFGPAEHHNPMELFSSTAIRQDDGTLVVYDKTQGVMNVQRFLCSVFGLATTDVRVLAPYVGGAFGIGLRPQYQVVLAVLAARVLARSVRVTVTRRQMFGLSYRPVTWQRVALAAAADGALESIVHEAIAGTSRFEDYTESVVDWSGMFYACENVTLSYRLAKLDLCTPADMRAPGAAWGIYALECAMDELAVKLRMDPLDLRLKNYSETNRNVDLPYSSKALRECYQQGAERFGWARRNPEPRSMREGDTLIGWGMASAVWEAGEWSSSARAVLTADGRLAVASATVDIGTGTYTIMTQIAAETLGVPIEYVTFTLGDSSLPSARVEGGSLTAGSVGSAVKAACDKVGARLFELARGMDRSPLADETLAGVTFADGAIRSRRDPERSIAIIEVMRRGGLDRIEETVSTAPQKSTFAHNVHSAVFVEVQVDADLGSLQVTRVVSAVAAGRILNPKTARSQLLGGVVWGIGMALEEESVIDQTFGKFINHNFAEYHVPVNADIHDIDVIFVDEVDTDVNPLGVKGIGEIGLVGVAAAIANAVYHATGARVRSLPITLDKVMEGRD